MFCVCVDVDNVCCCVEGEVEKVCKFVFECFVGELFLVIDNLECVIEMIDGDNEVVKLFLEGVEMIYKIFLSIIEKFGLSFIDL